MRIRSPSTASSQVIATASDPFEVQFRYKPFTINDLRSVGGDVNKNFISLDPFERSLLHNVRVNIVKSHFIVVIFDLECLCRKIKISRNFEDYSSLVGNVLIKSSISIRTRV